MASDYSDECLHQGELRAVAQIAQFYKDSYIKGELEQGLSIMFPSAMSRTKQLRFIAKVENKAIDAVVTVMKADVAKLTPFEWDSEAVKAQKRAAAEDSRREVRHWENEARSDADKGSNWSHDWSSNSHDLMNDSHAFRQLQTINIHHIHDW